MNRDIRFRGWDEYSRRMLQPGEFDLYQESDNGFHAGYSEPGGDWVQLDLMQFTGLRDKNGNAIYEGDVLTAGDGGIFEVKFEYAGFHFCTTPSSKYISYPAPCGNASRMEVIGNRYENPDLLEGLKC